MSTPYPQRKARSPRRGSGFPVLLLLSCVALMACDEPTPPPPKEMTIEPEPQPVVDVSPKAPPNCDADGVLKVGELSVLGLQLPVLTEPAGEVNGLVFLRSPHSLARLRTFFKKYYPQYEWKPGDERFGFSLSPAGKAVGPSFVIARGLRGEMRITIFPAEGEHQPSPKPPSGEAE